MDYFSAMKVAQKRIRPERLLAISGFKKIDVTVPEMKCFLSPKPFLAEHTQIMKVEEGQQEPFPRNAPAFDRFLLDGKQLL